MADDGTKFAWDEEKGDWKQVEGDEEEELEEEEEEVSFCRREALLSPVLVLVAVVVRRCWLRGSTVAVDCCFFVAVGCSCCCL